MTGKNRKVDKPVRILRSDLTGSYYAITSYDIDEAGNIYAKVKHDVTRDVEYLINDAMKRREVEFNTPVRVESEQVQDQTVEERRRKARQITDLGLSERKKKILKAIHDADDGMAAPREIHEIVGGHISARLTELRRAGYIELLDEDLRIYGLTTKGVKAL